MLLLFLSVLTLFFHSLHSQCSLEEVNNITLHVSRQKSEAACWKTNTTSFCDGSFENPFPSLMKALDSLDSRDYLSLNCRFKAKILLMERQSFLDDNDLKFSQSISNEKIKKIYLNYSSLTYAEIAPHFTLNSSDSEFFSTIDLRTFGFSIFLPNSFRLTRVKISENISSLIPDITVNALFRFSNITTSIEIEDCQFEIKRNVAFSTSSLQTYSFLSYFSLNKNSEKPHGFFLKRTRINLEHGSFFKNFVAEEPAQTDFNIKPQNFTIVIFESSYFKITLSQIFSNIENFLSLSNRSSVSLSNCSIFWNETQTNSIFSLIRLATSNFLKISESFFDLSADRLVQQRGLLITASNQNNVWLSNSTFTINFKTTAQDLSVIFLADFNIFLLEKTSVGAVTSLSTRRNSIFFIALNGSNQINIENSKVFEKRANVLAVFLGVETRNEINIQNCFISSLRENITLLIANLNNTIRFVKCSITSTFSSRNTSAIFSLFILRKENTFLVSQLFYQNLIGYRLASLIDRQNSLVVENSSFFNCSIKFGNATLFLLTDHNNISLFLSNITAVRNEETASFWASTFLNSYAGMLLFRKNCTIFVKKNRFFSLLSGVGGVKIIKFLSF